MSAGAGGRVFWVALVAFAASCGSGSTPRGADGAEGPASDGADAPAPASDAGPADLPQGDLASADGAGDRDAAPPATDSSAGADVAAGDGALPMSSSEWPSTIPIKGVALAPGAAGDPVCHASGWCWSNPTPMGGTLSVWALAADDVWVVGPHGTTRHFDGVAWKTVPTPTKANLHAVWGAISTSVWASGDGVLLYWDGTSWSMAGTSPTGHAMTGRNVADIWIANTNGVWHWDGSSWVPNVTSSCMDIYELADGTLYRADPTQGLVERLLGKNATSIGKLPSGFAGGWGIWAASATGDVWTVNQTQLLRYDRTKWQTVLELPGQFPAVSMAHVRGTGPDDVWITGSDGTILRWNGTGLERWPTGARELQRLAARAPGDVWAAGTGGALVHFEGNGWRRWFGGLPKWSGPMAAIGSEIWAVGESATRLRPGGSWEDVGTAGLPRAVMTEVWGSAPDDVWMLGTTVPDTELIAHWDGAKWTPRNGPDETVAYFSIWGSARDDVWVVGSDIIRWNGQGWKPFAAPTPKVIRYWTKVTGTSKDDVWLLGAEQGPDQVLLQWNGTSWIDHTASVNDAIGLAERSPRDVFAWSDSTIRHFDGQQWKVIRTVDPMQLSARSVSARAGELWTVAQRGDVDSWNGTAWTASDSLGGGLSMPVILATPGAVWLGSNIEGGGILRLPR